MRNTTITLLAAILLSALPAAAKITTVKGAKCIACHEGAPKDKKMNAAAAKWFPKFAEDKCKDCHGAADGKLTLNEAGKKAAK